MILACKIKNPRILGGFRYLKEISEIPTKFDYFSAKIGTKIAKVRRFGLKFVKISSKFATKIC
jgi:hypothetical protein